jgi:catechol-2,3-dioxygenase
MGVYTEFPEHIPAGPRRLAMAFRINHIHLKAPDPRKTAEWYVRAFNFKIVTRARTAGWA